MGRLDFLYREDIPHRAVSVYTYLTERIRTENAGLRYRPLLRN